MIHSLYLVYKACKYGRLNGSLSLVCKSPDSSKPRRRMRGRKTEEKAIKGRAAGGRNVTMKAMSGCGKPESDFLEWTWRDLLPAPTPPLAKVNFCADFLERRGNYLLARTMETVPQIRPPLPGGGDWAWARGSFLSSFWEVRFLQERSPLLEVQGTLSMHCSWGRCGFKSKLGYKDIGPGVCFKTPHQQEKKNDKRRLPVAM